jgi:hypothetical protein
MHHAMGERAGLARSGTRDHQERGVGRRIADAVLDRAALVGVELIEIGQHREGESLWLEALREEPCSTFVRNRHLTQGRFPRAMGPINDLGHQVGSRPDALRAA